MQESWKLDPQFRQEFLDACKEAATNDEAYAKFRTNDRISTVIENTPEWHGKMLMEAMGWSWTTIRYMYTYNLMLKLFGELDGSGIIEIGGGYGGQCKIIVDYSHPCSYSIYDLREVHMLQKTYLAKERVTGILFPTELKEVEPFDLLISWCAWGELETELKKLYLEKVISKAKHFFICSNYTPDEDKALLLQYFPEVKGFENELVSNVLYF